MQHPPHLHTKRRMAGHRCKMWNKYSHILTHRPMKNKAGTAAGNPRARADRASPTMNGNPNAQVRPICLDAHFHHDHQHVCIHFSPFFLFIYGVHHCSFFQQIASLLHGCTTCVFFCISWFLALVLVLVFALCRGCQPSFGFWPSGPGPGPAQVQLQRQGPQRLIRQCRPPLVRCGRVIPAHLIHWTQRHAVPASMSQNRL